LDDIDKQIVNVIKHTSAACEGLQIETEKLKWSELSKVLENLHGILRKYDEDLVRNLPAETKTLVANAMRKTLVSSLGFTDQTIALLQEERKSSRKCGHGAGDTQVSQYYRVSWRITNLAQVASQFDGSVLSSHLASEIPVVNLSHPVLFLYLI
jgi:hypothetical protein